MPFPRPQRRPAARALRSAQREAGFTLIELLAVMMIIAILGALVLGGVRAAKQRSALARTRGELAAIAAALEKYKAHFGDYPQTGNAGQATPIKGAAIAATQAQALLLNALIGVYGPSNFSTRLNGPNFLEIDKFRLEVELTTATRATFGQPQGTPPMKQAVANCLVDPWDNRYMYYYRPAPPSGGTAANPWRAPSYELYSVGPDGQHVAPAIATGLFTGTTRTTGTNADNIFANP